MLQYIKGNMVLFIRRDAVSLESADTLSYPALDTIDCLIVES